MVRRSFMPTGQANVARLLRLALARPRLEGIARAVSDWIDLQWSLLLSAIEQVAPEARGRLLDVGCGDKPYERLFRPYVREYVGVEYEATFRKTSAQSRAKGPDVVYDGKTLPFEDQSFDTVMSIQVLEHTPEPGHLIAEMARVLKPDGVLILGAPFSFRLHEEPHDYFRYTPHGLRVLCDQAGLRIDRIERVGHLWSLLGHKMNSFLGLEVARIGSIAQSMGKLGHESVSSQKNRLWLLPLVAPAMLGIAAGARVLDRALPDAYEALGFLVVARHVDSVRGERRTLPSSSPPGS
jgi:SAM-dependent methyltransferase